MLPIIFEYIFDFAIILGGIVSIVYLHGEIRYQEGIQKGMRMQRMIDRKIQRGEIYRLK